MVLRNERTFYPQQMSAQFRGYLTAALQMSGCHRYVPMYVAVLVPSIVHCFDIPDHHLINNTHDQSLHSELVHLLVQNTNALDPDQKSIPQSDVYSDHPDCNPPYYESHRQTDAVGTNFHPSVSPNPVIRPAFRCHVDNADTDRNSCVMNRMRIPNNQHLW